MKIREIRTWVLRHELPEAEVFGSSKGWHTVRQALVVEILTEDGLTGFGEAYGPPAVNRTLVDEVYAPRLVGKNALEHAVLWEDLYTTFRDYGRKGWPVAAISAIDIALWDLKGKALRQPVSRLLGGPSGRRSAPTPPVCTAIASPTTPPRWPARPKRTRPRAFTR